MQQNSITVVFFGVFGIIPKTVGATFISGLALLSALNIFLSNNKVRLTF